MTYTPTEQANIAVIQRYIEATNARDFDRAVQLYHPGAVVHIGNRVVTGRAAFRQAISETVGLLGTSKATLLDLAADGDTVAYRWSLEATLAANGARVSWDGAHFVKLREGLIAEDFALADTAEVQRRLGAALQPPTASSREQAPQ